MYPPRRPARKVSMEWGGGSFGDDDEEEEVEA